MERKYLKWITLLIGLVIISVIFFLMVNRDSKKTEILENEKSIGKEEEIEHKSILEVLEDNNETIDQKSEIIEAELLEELLSKDYYFAIYGTDERANEIPRSDIIMIVKYRPKMNEIIIVSIPRDTRVEIPNKGLDKINHAYAFGGPSLMTRTLEEFLLIDVNYYIKLSFDNFKEIIDTIGGVKVVAEKNFSYPDYIDISKGPQILDGEKALEYVRFRYDADGDYGRIQRQQEVLLSLIQWHQSNSVDSTESIVKKFYSKIDTNMSIESLQNFRKLLRYSEKNNFIQYTLETKGKIIERIWYEIYDNKSLEKIREILSNE